MSKLETNQVDPATGTTLTLGTSGDTITLGTGVVQSNFLTPSFRATMSADQSLANETFTKIEFDTETWDTNTAYDTSNYRFTVPAGQGGKYCFIAQIAIDNIDDTEHVDSAYYINGSRDDLSYLTVWISKATNGFGYVNNVYIRSLVATDYVEFFGAHSEGSSQNVEADYSYFGGYKIGT